MLQYNPPSVHLLRRRFVTAAIIFNGPSAAMTPPPFRTALETLTYRNGFWMTALPEPGLLTGQDLDALGAEFRRRHRCLIVREALAKPILEGLLAQR